MIVAIKIRISFVYQQIFAVFSHSSNVQVFPYRNKKWIIKVKGDILCQFIVKTELMQLYIATKILNLMSFKGNKCFQLFYNSVLKKKYKYKGLVTNRYILFLRFYKINWWRNTMFVIDNNNLEFILENYYHKFRNNVLI